MKMLNDKRWPETKRVVWKRAGGLCEWCRRDGQTGTARQALTVTTSSHSKAPRRKRRWSGCATIQTTVVLLCIHHHQQAHVELMSKTKAKVKERRAQAFERWKDRFK